KLSIEPGVIVKFDPGTSLQIGYYSDIYKAFFYGKLSAVGTATMPIIFMANSSSPAAGFWNGIQISSGILAPTTEISNVSILHATTGISLISTQLKPVIHHVRFENNMRGLSLSYSPGDTMPSYYSNSFINNTSATNNAIQFTTTSQLLNATLC